MKKHIWISGLKIHQIEERNKVFRNLKWVGEIPTAYSFHVFTNSDDTRGIVACSDAFGGSIAWARYEGKNPLIGKEMPSFGSEEIAFLKGRYPAFLEAITNI
jgi:hypothetical protein